MTDKLTRKNIVVGLSLLALALLPVIAEASGHTFLVFSFSRVLIYALAAISLDLILGYGGMVSFGHAAFFGVGAYVTGILAFHSFDGSTIFGMEGSNFAPFAWVASVILAAVAALVIGFFSLRTGGVYFIMITLAFAQMLFFFFISLEQYGGDDGLVLYDRNEFFSFDMHDDVTFYYICFVALIGFLFLCRQVVNSRFGMVIRGCKQNERRMAALGYPVMQYKLVAFIIAGAGAGLAGALMVNQNEFVSPDILHWSKSGEIMVMVILGGIGTLYGPVFGAVAFLMMEEFLPQGLEAIGLDGMKEHWRFIFGPLLIIIVLYARRGIYGILVGKEAEDG